MTRALATARLLVGVFLLATLITQIIDLQIGGSLVPSEYFTFFTIDSTILNIVVLIAGGITTLRGRTSPFLDAAAMALVPAAVVTGAVYNLTLRGAPSDKYLGMDWPNEVLHVAIPLFLVIDWFVLRSIAGRPRMGFGALGIAVTFPLTWLAFTIVRGVITGWFPYPFLQPDGPAGVGGMVTWIVGLTALIVVLATAAIAVTRVRRRGRGRRAVSPAL